MKKLLSLVGACAACVSMYAQATITHGQLVCTEAVQSMQCEWGKDFFNLEQNSTDMQDFQLTVI